MAVLLEEDLKRDIKNSTFAPIYILFGNDSFLKKFYFDKLCNDTYDGDAFFNLMKFQSDADLQIVYDAVVQYPMMSDKKCVALTDFDIESADKDALDRFCSLISAVETGCTFIIRFDSLDFDVKKSAKAKKILSAAEKIGGKAVDLSRRNVSSLIRLISETVKKHNCFISDADARYLVETSGDELSILKNEIEKLCAYKESGEINREIIDKVAIRTDEASVYDYVKDILIGKVSEALKSLDTMLFMQFEPMWILYTVSASYVDIYRVYAASAAGVNTSEVVKDFSYKNRAFVIERAKKQLSKLDFKRLDKSLSILVDTDKSLKSFGCDVKTVLEQMTVRLSYIAVKGEDLD